MMTAANESKAKGHGAHIEVKKSSCIRIDLHNKESVQAGSIVFSDPLVSGNQTVVGGDTRGYSYTKIDDKR